MPSSQNSSHPKNTTKRVKIAAHSSSAKQQNKPLLGLDQDKVLKDVEQGPHKKIYIPSRFEGNTGALAAKSSSSGWSWKKKIAIFGACTLAIIASISGGIYYIVSRDGNKSDGISNPNSTLATTTDFTGNTINPYLKNATNSYSRAAANSSTPSFDEKLKEASRNGDVFSETEFGEYNKSFIELEELELQEQSNSSLTSTNITNSYFENGIDLSNSTYDESSEREPQAQEDNGKEKNRNRREKVINPVATSAIRSFALPPRMEKAINPVATSEIGSSLSSFSVLTSAINSAISALTPAPMSAPTSVLTPVTMSVATSVTMSAPTSVTTSMPTSVPMSTPASTPKRYTLVLDPDSPTPSKTGATMEQMQVNVILKELSSSDARARFTPRLCSFLVDEFKSCDDMPKNKVFTVDSVGGVGSKRTVSIKDSSNNEIDDIIKAAKRLQSSSNTPSRIRAIKILGGGKFSLYLESSFKDQDKFLGFFDERVQRHDPELAKFGYDIIAEFFITTPADVYWRGCLSRSNYRFEELPSTFVDPGNGVTVSFRVYDAEAKAVTELSVLCDLLAEDRLPYLQETAGAKYMKEQLTLQVSSMLNFTGYRLYSDVLINGTKTGEAVGKIVTLEEGRGGVFTQTLKILQGGRSDLMVYKAIRQDGSVLFERKQEQRKSGGAAPTWVNVGFLAMDVTKGTGSFWHNKKLTGWTESHDFKFSESITTKYPLPERVNFSFGKKMAIEESAQGMGKIIVLEQFAAITTPSVKNLTAKRDHAKSDHDFQATFNSFKREEVRQVGVRGAPGTIVTGATGCVAVGPCCPKAL